MWRRCRLTFVSCSLHCACAVYRTRWRPAMVEEWKWMGQASISHLFHNFCPISALNFVRIVAYVVYMYMYETDRESFVVLKAAGSGLADISGLM